MHKKTLTILAVAGALAAPAVAFAQASTSPRCERDTPARSARRASGTPRARASSRIRRAMRCSRVFRMNRFGQQSSGRVAPELRPDFGLSPVALGQVSAAFFWAFALAQLPLAVTLDRVGARRSMAAPSLVGAAGAALFATADDPAGASGH